MLSPTAVVIRGGERITVDATLLVPGEAHDSMSVALLLHLCCCCYNACIAAFEPADEQCLQLGTPTTWAGTQLLQVLLKL